MRTALTTGIALLLAGGPAFAAPAPAAVARTRPAAAVARHQLAAAAPHRAHPAARDARTAAAVARALATSGGGTATWVRAPGKAVTTTMFPGEPGLFGAAQRRIDKEQLIVVLTADHVSTNIPHPPGYTPPPAVAAGAVAEARTGRVISVSVFTETSQAAAWKARMAKLGTVRRVAVPR
jgi:hypothetical protein